jgi:hypothetical protein
VNGDLAKTTTIILESLFDCAFTKEFFAIFKVMGLRVNSSSAGVTSKFDFHIATVCSHYAGKYAPYIHNLLRNVCKHSASDGTLNLMATTDGKPPSLGKNNIS